MEKKSNVYNKITQKQKTIMAEFMRKHPSLARNIISSCPEGKAIAEGLWQMLTSLLNDVGPPFKDARVWKKVFADQKYQAKKKMSFNKFMTRGGDIFYEQKRISMADKIILEASGLEFELQTNELPKNHSQTHSTSTVPSHFSQNDGDDSSEIKFERTTSIDSMDSLVSEEPLHGYPEHSDFENENEQLVACSTEQMQRTTEQRQSSEKVVYDIDKSIEDEDDSEEIRYRVIYDIKEKELAQEEFQQDSIKNISKEKTHDEDEEPIFEQLQVQSPNQNQFEFQQRIEAKLDRLLDIQERMLQIKEEKHKSVIALNSIKLQIKTLELERLKAT